MTRRGGTGDDAGVEVASTADGGVVVAGRFRGTMTLGGAPISAAGGFSAWIARYGADGSHRWSVAVGDGDTNVTGIAVDSDGAVYAFGSFTGPVNFGGGVRSASTGLYLVKLSATGGYQWDRVFMTDYAIPGRIALLGADRIAICGIVNNTPIDFGGGTLLAGAINGYVAVFAASTGVHAWSKILTTGDDANSVDLVDVGGDVVVIGDFGTTASLGGALLTAESASDAYLVRYRGVDGAHTWSIRQGGGGVASRTTPRRAATNGTHLLVGGYFRGMVNLGGAPLISPGTATSAFVAAYNVADGSSVWSQPFSSDTSASVVSIAATPTKLSLSIIFEGKVTIGIHQFAASPLHADTAIARINPATGAPGATATHFASSAASSGGRGVGATASIAYSGDRLAGVGTFAGSTNLLGTNLTSAGGTDIAMFRVDF